MTDKIPTRAATPERELAESQATELARRERRTARNLLLLERAALLQLHESVRISSVSTALAVARGRDRDAVVRHEQQTLEAVLEQQLLDARTNARQDGIELLANELDFGIPARVSSSDSTRAIAGAAALAGGWALIASATDRAGLQELPTLLEGRVRRTAVTEVAHAFNGGRADAIEEQGASKPGLYKVWSAILDSKTCDRCGRADGETVEASKSFRAGLPPLHPFCRCIIEHVIVPKPQRLEDVAIDYELFKSELQDVIRERREISDRHAVRFLSESLGNRRSPEALTRRFAHESYATTPRFTPRRRPSVSGPSIAKPAPPPAPPPIPPRVPPGGGGGGSGGSGTGGPREPLRFVSHLTEDIVCELGATRRGDIAGVTKDLFQGRCPDADSWRRLWEPPPGYRVDIKRFEVQGGDLRVHGALRTEAGVHVSDVTRVFARIQNELVVSHDYLALEEAHQGRGIGEAMTRHAILGYREMGADRVTVNAHWVGRYTWARFGFSWLPPEGERWRAKLETFLVRELGNLAQAKELSGLALVGAHAVAGLEVEGKRLGKKFLMNTEFVPHWSGELRLADGDVGYEVARKRLKL